MNTPEESAPEESAQTVSASRDEGSSRSLSQRLWELFVALATWILSVALLVLPQILAVPYIIYRYQGAPPSPDVLLEDKTLILLLVSGLLPVHLITLGLAWAVATRFGKVPIKEALRWQKGSRTSILKSIGLAVVLFGLAWGITLAFGGKETDIDKIIKSSRAAALILAFLAVATAPLVEEIIYRGILFPAWQRLTGSTIAVIVVTLSFALPHIPQYRANLGVISAITMLSLVLTIVRARTGRLLPCYVIHMVFNGITSVLIVIQALFRLNSESPPPDVTPTIALWLLGMV